MTELKNPPAETVRAGGVVFINLWGQGGMKHYSESLVNALAPATRLFYIRNYPGGQPVDGMIVDLTLNPFRLKNAWELFRITRALLRLRPAAIHLNSENPQLLPIYPLLGFFNSVITLHDARPHAGERLLKRLFHWLHLACVFVFIRKVIVHAETIRSQLPAAFEHKSVSTLAHINYNHWARDKRPPAAQWPFVVLFFGRILEYKGLAYLVEAFRGLDPERVQLVIAGEGELPAGTGGKNITGVPGFIGDEKMTELFNQAHVIALPYVAASQSGVGYMALAFEKPVIATRVGALPDLVSDGVNGLLVEPRSATALTAAITQISAEEIYGPLRENIRKQNISSDLEIRSALLGIYRE